MGAWPSRSENLRLTSDVLGDPSVACCRLLIPLNAQSLGRSQQYEPWIA